MTIASKFKKLIADRQGNIAITFAIAMLPLTLSVGAAVDYSQSAQLRSNISSATDAALLSATTGIMDGVDLENQTAVEKELKKSFEPFFLANMPKSYRSDYRGYKISYSPKTRAVSVDVKYEFRTAVLGIAGMDKLKVDVAAATRLQMSAGGAVSMFLVLDKSGSMGSPADGKYCPWWKKCGNSKMDSLKAAVLTMSNQFETIDPKHLYVRMGAVSYDSRTQKQMNLGWGTAKSNKYVQNLRAGGGTDSAKAVKKAYNHLKHKRENQEHQKKSQQDATKVMVFMTDGSNNRASADTATIKTCNKAKKQKIEIYTVAFLAPWRGQKLLKACATDGAHYFEAKNSKDLINAFKKIGQSVGEKLVLSK